MLHKTFIWLNKPMQCRNFQINRPKISLRFEKTYKKFDVFVKYKVEFKVIKCTLQNNHFSFRFFLWFNFILKYGFFYSDLCFVPYDRPSFEVCTETNPMKQVLSKKDLSSLKFFHIALYFKSYCLLVRYSFFWAVKMLIIFGYMGRYDKLA